MLDWDWALENFDMIDFSVFLIDLNVIIIIYYICNFISLIIIKFWIFNFFIIIFN